MGPIDRLRSLVEQTLEMVEAEPPPAGLAEVRRDLGFVLAAVGRLSQPAPAGDSVVALRDVCRFLEIRGEGLRDDDFARAVGLPLDTFARLENAARRQSDLDAVANGIAAAGVSLAGAAWAGPLLSEAAAVGKALASGFWAEQETAGGRDAGSELRLEDACRVLERLFRFSGTDAIARATGVPREVIEQMHSAAASAGKRG